MNVNLPLIEIILFFVLGGIISFGYYTFLFATLKKVKKVHKKGLFLLGTSLLRFLLFIFLTYLITQFTAGKFIWYVAGFIVGRFCTIPFIKKGKLHD